jgi:hypothetical protein
LDVLTGAKDKEDKDSQTAQQSAKRAAMADGRQMWATKSSYSADTSR